MNYRRAILKHHRAPAAAGRHEAISLLLLSVLVLIVPTVCVLWFMNQAMRNERLAVRQRLIEVYRGEVLKVRDQVETRWNRRMAALNSPAKAETPAQRFGRIVRSGAADSVVVYDGSGRIAYPRQAPPAEAPPSAVPPGWAEAERLEFTAGSPARAEVLYSGISRKTKSRDLAARALLGRVRCLAKAKRVSEALAKSEYAFAADPNGRFIIPEADLFALQLIGRTLPAIHVGTRDFDRPLQARSILTRLIDRLNDYRDPLMPSDQRRFLMHQVLALPGSGGVFPTLAAEDLAAAYRDAELEAPRTTDLSRTELPDLWSAATPDKTALALFTTRALAGEIEGLISRTAQLTGARLQVVPAGARGSGTEPLWSIPAARHLPGWTLALFLTGPDPFASAVQRQRLIYLWIALLVIGTVTVLTVLAAVYLLRQLKLTRLKNNFVATVSHEIKTPLASMRVLVDTLLEGRCRDEKQSREYLELIGKENERLSRLIDNFLTFSRMERNKQAFDFSDVQPGQIVAMAREASNDRFSAGGFELTVNVEPHLPAIWADRDALVTVLLNLLDNAYKYSENDKRVTLRAYARDGGTAFEVADHGLGLSRRDARRIFDRFYQADQTLSRRTGGCGLGLSIVKFIVDAHGGTIAVDSHPGKGSVFTIHIPGSAKGGTAWRANPS
jgi:signal transduction histidine kinase